MNRAYKKKWTQPKRGSRSPYVSGDFLKVLSRLLRNRDSVEPFRLHHGGSRIRKD